MKCWYSSLGEGIYIPTYVYIYIYIIYIYICVYTYIAKVISEIWKIQPGLRGVGTIISLGIQNPGLKFHKNEHFKKQMPLQLGPFWKVRGGPFWRSEGGDFDMWGGGGIGWHGVI